MSAVTSTNPLKPSQVPKQGAYSAVHDWASLAIQEGQAFLASQTGFDDIDKVIDAVMGPTSRSDDFLRPSSISNLSLNHMGKIGLDLASSLTDIKPFFEYKVTNTRFEQQAEMGQKLATAWWLNRMIDLRFCDVVKYALAGGSGYAHLTYNADLKDLDLIPEDPRDVMPIRPNDMISVQNAFGQVIRRERTVNYLRQKYPQFASQIHADREGSYASLAKNTRYQKVLDALGLRSGFMQNLYSSLGGKAQAAPLNVPVADLYTIYCHDDSLNETGEAQVMGDPETNWSYLVQPGEPLYPRGRCVTLIRSCREPLYDGPNPYWHGQFPAPKLTLDPWPWTWLGKSPLRDLLPIQKEINRTARGISDFLEKLWRPDLIGDKNSVSKQLMDKIDTRRAGLKMRTNPVAGQGVQLAYPPVEKLVAAMEWLKFMIEEGKELSGTQELSSLVQLGQIPSSETVERMIESWSPAIRLRSRVMEAFLREVAMITLMNFFQFYTTAQRIAVLGPKGLTFEDFDFDPGTLIPDMLDFGLSDSSGNPLPRAERAKKFITFFTYQIAPGSLLAASEVTDKLMYLQLARMGVVDFVTMMEKLKVNNIAPPQMLEQMGSTIMERLMWQQQMGIGMAPGPAAGGGKGGGPGRPASGQQMPRIKISESG